jgi:hypothetical protein
MATWQMLSWLLGPRVAPQNRLTLDRSFEPCFPKDGRYKRDGGSQWRNRLSQ